MGLLDDAFLFIQAEMELHGIPGLIGYEQEDGNAAWIPKIDDSLAQTAKQMDLSSLDVDRMQVTCTSCDAVDFG
jgi:hypothetical protein